MKTQPLPPRHHRQPPQTIHPWPSTSLFSCHNPQCHVYNSSLGYKQILPSFGVSWTYIYHCPNKQDNVSSQSTFLLSNSINLNSKTPMETIPLRSIQMNLCMYLIKSLIRTYKSSRRSKQQLTQASLQNRSHHQNLHFNLQYQPLQP